MELSSRPLSKFDVVLVLCIIINASVSFLWKSFRTIFTTLDSLHFTLCDFFHACTEMSFLSSIFKLHADVPSIFFLTSCQFHPHTLNCSPCMVFCMQLLSFSPLMLFV